MKKLFIYFLLLPLFFSCEQPKSRFEIIKEMEENELARGVRHDSIFLDFVFGMSKKQVDDHFARLYKSGKITADYNNKYQYKFVFDHSTADATFNTDFYNDSLYKFSLVLEGGSSAVLNQLSLVMIMMNKYMLTGVESVFDENEKDYIGITGNRKIEISYPILDKVVLTYTDIIMEQKKKQQEETEKNFAKKKIIDDL